MKKYFNFFFPPLGKVEPNEELKIYIHPLLGKDGVKNFLKVEKK